MMVSVSDLSNLGLFLPPLPPPYQIYENVYHLHVLTSVFSSESVVAELLQAVFGRVQIGSFNVQRQNPELLKARFRNIQEYI